MSHIYDYLAEIKARPEMYSGDKNLWTIENLLNGYVACLWENNLTEDYEGRPFHPREFATWLYEEFGWSGALGFATAIHDHTPDNETAFSTFFDLVEQFRYSTEE